MSDRQRIAVPLTRTDAWLLAALTDASHDGRFVNLADFVDAYDWLMRAIPTFDEVSFGVPRLMAAGFADVKVDRDVGFTIRALPAANALRESLPAEMGGVIFSMPAALGAAPYPEVEMAEDRSLGPLAGLEPEHLDLAVRRHSVEVERLAQPLIEETQKWIRSRVGSVAGPLTN